ncbi:MAG: hydroxypyruvate isomerase family protein [Geminicoccales bacterium]
MARYRYSANTGYLWQELPFLDRIRRAAAHGFDAVEFHDEGQQVDREALKDVLAEASLPIVGLNVRMGDTTGSAAIPALAEQTKHDIAEAIDLAESIGAGGVHVLAGKAEGKEAHRTYLDNLTFALRNTDLSILIEPVCSEQLPGYFLRTVEQAGDVLSDIGHPRLKIMFDCYHVFRESGTLLEPFHRHVHSIGHVQIASAEGRAEPFPGALDYGTLLPAFQDAGYTGLFGGEYRPRTTTEDGLTWRDSIP